MCFSLFKATSQLVSAARSGNITDARKLFDKMPRRDTVAWNAMLTSYSHLGIYPQVFSLFHQMRVSNIKPDDFTFTATLSACAGVGDARFGSRIHALVVAFGCFNSLPVSNALIDMYGKCMYPCNARKLFDEMGLKNEVSWCSLLFAFVNTGLFHVASEVFWSMPKRVEISWNIMIAGHARYGDYEVCLTLFRRMRESGFSPDGWTFSALMNACSESREFCYGPLIHSFVIKSGWYSAVEVQNSILSFYVELGCKDDICKALQSIENSNQISWNAVIDAHMKMGNTREASVIFQKLQEKNVVSWTSMIAGYTRNAQEIESINLFVDMMRDSVEVDELTFGAVLLACSGLAVLGHGMMIHGCLIRHGFSSCVYVGNGLVNMYAKCGDLLSSTKAFGDTTDKDLVSWNTMLFAYGLHGRASQVLQHYAEMLAYGMKPDVVTFIGLLMTCSHSGLVENAQSFFNSMLSVHGLSHDVHHVACIIDLLGRSGYLAEAKLLANDYQVQAVKIRSSEAILGACSSNLDIGLATQIGEYLMHSDPQKEMSYVLLSNLYCATGQWKAAEMMRKAMANRGVKKVPGCSWIEVRNELTSFTSGNYSQPFTDDICNILYILEHEMRHPCLFSFSN